MTFEVDTPALPVTNWAIHGLPRQGVLLVNFEFLVHSMKTPEQSGRQNYGNYVLTVEQARFLALAIYRQLGLLDMHGG
jgi:hypothetical protein